MMRWSFLAVFALTRELLLCRGEGVLGDASCPCIDLDQVELLRVSGLEFDVLASNDTTVPADYGVTCQSHDESLPACELDCGDIAADEGNLIPAPFCDKSWCHRSWCYVDPTNCKLLNRRSTQSPNLFYSYATCGFADSFTRNTRFLALQNKVVKAGFNSNTGGWMGAYNENRTHFKGPVSAWHGPLVEFVQQAALRGGFTVKLTEPPEVLREHSEEFFQSASSFDYCVYTSSLGYVDLCVSQYTVTDARASTTDFLLLGSSGIYLVASQDDGDSWDRFYVSLTMIFRPFTFGTWLFIIFFVIPALGCLMIVHEFGRSGSAYPREETVVVFDDKRKTHTVRKIKVPFAVHIIKSIYVNLLAVLQSSYEQTVISVGAMLNLLGISFFILTLIAVYTANLAAILTTDNADTRVQSLEDAVQSNLRICSERKNMETVTKVFGVQSTSFVLDPVELGGDGKPGFNCPGCNNRRRVFEFMDPVKAETDPRYCHVAVAPEEDLEVYHANGDFCNKVVVGTPITFVQTGIPIFEQISPELTSFFLHMKNEGLFEKIAESSRPSSTCPSGEGREGEALSIIQLTGIWVVSFGFAIVGLIATAIQPYVQPHFQKVTGRVERLQQRDQRGGRIEATEVYEYLHESTRCLTVEGNDRNSRHSDAAVLAVMGSSHSRRALDLGSSDFDSRLSAGSVPENTSSTHSRKRVWRRGVFDPNSSSSGKTQVTTPDYGEANSSNSSRGENMATLTEINDCESDTLPR